MARVLISSNGPHTPTGYGTQSKAIASALRAAGHDIYFYAWYGLQGGMLGSDGMVMIPRLQHEYGGDAGVIAHTFDVDVVLTLQDIWVLPEDFATTLPCPWVAYFPHDGDPMPGPIVSRAKTADYPVVFTEHALHAAIDHGIDATMIPHMVDANVFRVLSEEERVTIRSRADIAPDEFVITIVAANKGYPSRKNYPQMLEGVADFMQSCPDANVVLYIHTNERGSGAIPLQQMLDQFGLRPITRFPEQVRYSLALYTPKDLNEIYNSSDILLMPSAGEGFGLPIVEAQMAGLPVIGQDCTSFGELVYNGRLAPRGTPQYTPLGHYQYQVNPMHVADALRAEWSEWKERGMAPMRDLAIAASNRLKELYSHEAVSPMWADMIARVIEEA